MTSVANQGSCRGQALLETLLVVPLFLVLAFGTVLIAHITEARLDKLGIAKRADHSPAHFAEEERQRAQWGVQPSSVDALLAEAKQDAPRLACPNATDVDVKQVCLSATHHEQAATLLSFGGIRSLLPALEDSARAHTLTLKPESPFLPGALTPYEERSRHHSNPLLLSFVARSAASHPARHGGPLGSRWDDSSGFNLSTWMATRVPKLQGGASNSRHPHPLSHDLESIRLRAARNARKAQAAACGVESVYSNFGVGAVVELVSSAVIEGGSQGKGCPNASAVANAISKAADALLTAKALEVLALEACATTAATASSTSSELRSQGSCTGLGSGKSAKVGNGIETLFRKGVLHRFASGE